MDEILIFRLDSSEWALSAEIVHQILTPRPVTRLPDPPPLVCGLVAWRARVLPVIALGERLDCKNPPVDRCTLLVTEASEDLVALAVDKVMQFEQDEDEMERRGIQLLDLDQLLSE
jgi:chemotaxis signal transduction protein